jgi:hypothetical protein
VHIPGRGEARLPSVLSNPEVCGVMIYTHVLQGPDVDNISPLDCLSVDNHDSVADKTNEASGESVAVQQWCRDISGTQPDTNGDELTGTMDRRWRASPTECAHRSNFWLGVTRRILGWCFAGRGGERGVSRSTSRDVDADGRRREPPTGGVGPPTGSRSVGLSPFP